MIKIKQFIKNIGLRGITFAKGLKNFFNYLHSIIISFRSLKRLKLRAINKIIINQTKFTGIDALPFVIFISLLIGGTIIIQSTKNFPKFGIENFIGNLLVVIIGRELGPLLTALIVVGRSGSAIATEIATQKWSKEILTFELLGIDTKLYIVIPRIVASILAIFGLIIMFDIAAFFGGYIISQTSVYIPVDVFIRSLLDSFSLTDLFSVIIKSVAYGILIPLIACYYGFMPKSKFEIPIYVSKAVIRTLVTIFIINAIISVLFYF